MSAPRMLIPDGKSCFRTENVQPSSSVWGKASALACDVALANAINRATSTTRTAKLTSTKDDLSSETISNGGNQRVGAAVQIATCLPHVPLPSPPPKTPHHTVTPPL